MDKYDKAIQYLTENPDEIYRAWDVNWNHKEAGCLFEQITPRMGCLTQVKSGAWSGDHPITKKIEADDRIPLNGCMITLESLPVFAEWQRRLDKELGPFKSRA